MSSTMTLSSRIFPTVTPVPGPITGTLVPGTISEVLQLVDGAAQSLTAPLNVAGPGNPPTYSFIFWDVDSNPQSVQPPRGVPDPQQTVNFDAPAEQAFDATAWYVPSGPGGGRGGTGVTAWAFSLNQEEVLPNSPFGSVSPAFAQLSANTVSTTASDQPVIITASSLIVGFGRFNSWLQFFGNGIVTGPTLTVPAGGVSEAIAFYSIPVPDPCENLRLELANFDCSGTGLTLAECERIRKDLQKQLQECERQYGEPITAGP